MVVGLSTIVYLLIFYYTSVGSLITYWVGPAPDVLTHPVMIEG